MSRRARFFMKKRGSRSTGSRQLGNAGLAIFFAVFLLIGGTAFGVMIWKLVIPEWRVNRQFVQHTCTVLGTRVGESDGEEGSTYRPEIHIRYEVDGRTYDTWTYDIVGMYSSGQAAKQAICDQFVPGRNYKCWYDPRNPETAVLVQGLTWSAWAMLLLPLSFMAIGGGGLSYALLNVGKSAERRAALSRNGLPMNPFDDNGGAADEFPYVPRDLNLTNSPGTQLAYRLPASASPGWVLFGLAVACVLWNGMVSLFVTVAVRSHLNGDPEWVLTFFMIPFVVVGISLIYFCFRQLLITTGVGPTCVEISHHPLLPGEEYKIHLTQGGRLIINSLNVTLTCHERASYQQGTNTRTDTRTVYEERIFSRDGFEIQPGLPFEALTALRIPQGAMHSFKASHNEIGWQLVVKGDLAGWPDFERAFPVVVLPAREWSDTP